MRAFHAIALMLCAFAPPTWIAVVVALVLTHGDSVVGWSLDDWAVLVALVVGIPLLAAALLRLPAPAPRRTHALR